MPFSSDSPKNEHNGYTKLGEIGELRILIVHAIVYRRKARMEKWFSLTVVMVILYLAGLPHVSSRECKPTNGKELAKCNSVHEITIILFRQNVYRTEENITLPQPSAVTIIGNGAHILCTREAGLKLSSKTMINISNVTICNCGTQHFFSEKESYGVMIALLIIDSNMVTMTEVVIENSTGIGLALINCNSTITVHNSKFNNNHLVSDDRLIGGGGIHIQQMRPLDSSVNIDIAGCSFTNNNASIGKFKLEKFPLYRDNMAYLLYGRGGGLSANLNTCSVNLTVSNCVFEENIAHRGGGLFLFFLGHSCNSSVSITENNFTANQCTTQKLPESVYSAGGAVAVLYHSKGGCNKCYITDCFFTNNTAYYGGGLSMGTEKREAYERGNVSMFLIEKCHFEGNSAQIGSAMDFFCNPITESSDCQCIVNPTIKNTDLMNNEAFYTYTDGKRGRSSSTLHLESLRAKFEGDVIIASNQASGIGLETGTMDICTNASITLSNNSGRIGGGIVAVGESQITFQTYATLTLIENLATEKGGGMYIEQPHRFFSVYSYACFLQYYNDTIEPSKWKVNITFYKNRANGHANAIFTSSIYPCVWPGINNSLSEDIHSTFCRWENFNFHVENCSDLIRTLPQTFTREGYEIQIYPSTRKKIDQFGVLDDLSHDVTNKSLFTTCLFNNSSNMKSDMSEPDLNDLGLSVSAPNGYYLMLVQTAYHRSISTIVNVTVLECPAGYDISSKGKGCTCNFQPAHVSSILSCAYDIHGPQLRVFIGYCAGIDTKKDLVYSKCPFTANYFAPIHSANYTPENFNEEFCKQHTRTGFLCQKCKQDYGIDIFSPRFTCIPCNKTMSYVNWMKALAVVIGPQTVFFLLVIVFHIGITAPAMNGYIFFSHAVTLPLQTLILQSAWTLDLQHVSENKPRALTDIVLDPYRIWNFDYPEIFQVKVCLYESLKIMHAIAFRYVHALFPIVLLAVALLFIELHARNCKPVVYMWKPLCFLCVRFRRKWEVKTSVIDAFATVILLSYSKIINTSLNLLTRNFVRDSSGFHVETRLDYDTSVVYFKGQHIIYASVAIAMLSTFGLIPPVLLMLYPNRHFFKLLTKFKLDGWHGLHVFVETFHGSFKNRTNGLPERRWFAGIYFIFRIIVFMIFALSEELVQLHLYLVFTYTAFLLLLVFLRPYKRNFYTCLDASFLAILIVVSSSIVYCAEKVLLEKRLPSTLWRLTYAILWIPTIYIAIYGMYLVCARSRSRFIQRYCVSNVRRFRDTAVMYFANRPQQGSESLLTNKDSNCTVTAELPTHSSLDDFSITPDRVDNPQRYYSMDWSNNFGTSFSVVSVDREKDREELRSKRQ